LKIPPFGALYKKIKIAQYRLHLNWKREKEEEMRFQKRQAYNKKSTPKFLPVIPLLPTKLSSDELKDKAVYITFTLQVSINLEPYRHLFSRIAGLIFQQPVNHRSAMIVKVEDSGYQSPHQARQSCGGVVGED
jgi:hypothetical protein